MQFRVHIQLFFVAVAALMVYLSATLNVGYYTRADLLGIMSKFPGLMILLGIILGLSMFYVLENDKLPALFRQIPLVLLILYLFVLPIGSEKYNITDFYDAPGHMTRAMYVAQTGHSNINVDRYFDIQPGVFYSTAMLMLVTGISPYFITKWFPMFFVMYAYLPALMFLGKSLFKGQHLILYIFFTLVITWASRYHYSAQMFSLPLFVILVSLLMRSAGEKMRRDVENSLVIMTIFPAIIIYHQLTSLGTLIVFMTTSIFLPLARKKSNFLSFKRIRNLTLVFLVFWLTYLTYLTVYTFGDFVCALKNIVEVMVRESLPSLIASAIHRPDPLYEQLNIAKVLFTAIIWSTSWFILAYAWLNKGRDRLGPASLMMLTVNCVIYMLGLPLGGAGYIERAVLLTGFLAALGLTILVSNVPRNRIASLLIATLLISLTVTGSALFNSCRNFQFTTYSEDASSIFLERFEPINNIPVYIELRLADLSWTDYETLAHGRPKSDALIFTLHAFIQRSYWMPEGFDPISKADQNAELIKIYSNNISAVYLAK